VAAAIRIESRIIIVCYFNFVIIYLYRSKININSRDLPINWHQRIIGRFVDYRYHYNTTVSTWKQVQAKSTPSTFQSLSSISAENLLVLPFDELAKNH